MGRVRDLIMSRGTMAPSIRNNPYGRKNDIQPDTPGTMVPCDIMRTRTRPITPQDHHTLASIA